MHFEIDTVSEFTYFQNLLLGLADALSKCVNVKRTYLRKTIPLVLSDIYNWEKTQGVSLPEDLRLFYSSSNGYLFEWTYAFGDKETVVGKVEINQIEKLHRVYGYQTTHDSGITVVKHRFLLRLNLESKIYELAVLPERGKVVLVYLYPNYKPSIWLATPAMDFYYLADDITTYFRMAIAHLGIPLWQLAYTPEGLPQWSENIFRMIIPSFSTSTKKTLERMKKDKRRKKDSDFPEVPLNKLDPNLFTVLPRSTDPTTTTSPIPTLPPANQSIPEKPKLSKRKQMLPIPRVHTPVNSYSPRKYKRKPLYYVKKR